MKKQIKVIISIMVMTSIIANMAHPVTPTLVYELGYDSFLYGVLFASMSLSNFIMAPVWGNLSDQLGRKRFLIFGPIGYGLAQFGFGYSTNPYIIILFRLLAGGTVCATFVVGMAYLIDVSDPKNRSKVMAIYTALTGFGATLGNLLGGWIGNEDYHITFLYQGILSILSTVIIFIFIKEIKPKTTINRDRHFIKNLKKYNGTILLFLLLIIVLTSVISTGFNISFNSYMKEILKLKPLNIGIIMAITGVIGLITNIIIFPLIKRKLNDYYVLISSILLLSLALFMATFFSEYNFNITLFMLIIFFAFLALYRPLIQSILSKTGNNNGEIMGLNNASTAFGNVLGSFYAGALFVFSPLFTFYSFALITFVVFILLVIKKKEIEPYVN